MATANEVELLPDPDQHKLLSATLERVNRASNAARASGLQRNVFDGAPLREIVKEEVEKAKLPDGFVRAIADRVQSSLKRRAGKQPKFSTYQSLALPASAFKWAPGADRVTMLTASGRRTIAARVDRSRGDRPRSSIATASSSCGPRTSHVHRTMNSRLHEQALHRVADDAAFVVDPALGHPDTMRLRPRA
jgi:hypothetical protein